MKISSIWSYAKLSFCIVKCNESEHKININFVWPFYLQEFVIGPTLFPPLAVRILFGHRVPHIAFVLKTLYNRQREGVNCIPHLCQNASKPTKYLLHFPRRHLASLSNHFVKVLHLHEHLVHSTLPYIFVNETLPYSLINTGIFFFNKPTLPKKHCS